MKNGATLAGCLIAAGAWAQVKVGLPNDYYSYQGKFKIDFHNSFRIIPYEQREKETNLLLEVAVDRKLPTNIIKGQIYLYKNSKNELLKEWADAGRRTWVTEPGYTEEKYEEVDWMKGKAWVHTFTFHLLDGYGKARDRYRMKSIRYMRGGVGYWFVFYANPKFFEDYVRAWDASLKSILWDDDKKDPVKKDGG